MIMAEMGPEELEVWFAAARAHPPVPAPAFLDRLAQDAARTVPAVATAAGLPAARPAVKRSPLAKRRDGRRLIAGLGGWRAVSGLAAAAVVGLWIGLALPDSMRDFAPTVGAAETLDLFAAADGYFGEG